MSNQSEHIQIDEARRNNPAEPIMGWQQRAEIAEERVKALENKNAHMAMVASKAITFKLNEEICVDSRGLQSWVVSNGTSVRNTFGEWEWEPRPSSRNDEFIARTRFTFAKAWKLATSLVEYGENNEL